MKLFQVQPNRYFAQYTDYTKYMGYPNGKMPPHFSTNVNLTITDVWHFLFFYITPLITIPTKKPNFVGCAIKSQIFRYCFFA